MRPLQCEQCHTQLMSRIQSLQISRRHVYLSFPPSAKGQMSASTHTHLLQVLLTIRNPLEIKKKKKCFKLNELEWLICPLVAGGWLERHIHSQRYHLGL